MTLSVLPHGQVGRNLSRPPPSVAHRVPPAPRAFHIRRHRAPPWKQRNDSGPRQLEAEGGRFELPRALGALAVFKTAAFDRARPPLRARRSPQPFGGAPPRESSSSITSLNFSMGCAPESRRPLMKKAGVPFTPACEPSAISFSIAALNSCLARQSSNFLRSSLSSSANALSFSSERSSLAKSLSW